jgi:hypothetical protein
VADKTASLFGSFLVSLGFTARTARWSFLFCGVLLLVVASRAWSLVNSPIALATDEVFLIVEQALLLIVLLTFTGWLGFSAKGKTYLETASKREIVEPKYVRLAKVLFATGALLVSVLIVLCAFLLMIDRDDVILLIFFDPNVTQITLITLAVLCLPFVIKWLK